VFNFLFSGCIAERDFTPGVSVLAYEILFYCHIGIGQMLQFNRYFTFFQNHWDDTATIAILIFCIADRDFTPGVSVLDNIVEAIHSSNKVILVLTDHFVSSQWCKYEADQAIIRSLRLNDVQDQDCNSSCVIPVILEK
jgi:hypothetical protein